MSDRWLANSFRVIVIFTTVGIAVHGWQTYTSGGSMDWILLFAVIAFAGHQILDNLIEFFKH